RQIVGMDLHRRRSVLVRMTDTGEHLETVRISNDPEYLRAVMARAGEAPEVVLEAMASQVAAALGQDAEVRGRYMTAVVARVCGLDWSIAAQLSRNPAGFPQPAL